MVFGNFGKFVGDVASGITDTTKDVRRMGRDMNTAYKGVQSLTGAPSTQRGAAAKTDPRTRSSAMYPDVRHSTAPTQNITDYTQQDEYPDYHVLDSQVVDASGKRFFQNSAPTGTRLIMPREFSSTGKERYFGANVLESIMNLRDGKENCGNIIVMAANGGPSPAFYDRGPNGEILLKGTNKEVKINADGSNASIRLSETEFLTAVKALDTQTAEKTYFKTSADKGDAANSTATEGSWFSRNWWKILLGMVVAAGIAWGGIEILNHRKESKDKKAAKAALSAATNENTNTTTNTNEASVASASSVARTFSATKITQEGVENASRYTGNQK